MEMFFTNNSISMRKTGFTGKTVMRCAHSGFNQFFFSLEEFILYIALKF